MNENLWFEIKAKAFNRMTSLMAPGKDQSPYANEGQELEKIRTYMWEQWSKENANILHAVKMAIEEVMLS